jgi:hypothetical protein
MDRIRPVVWAMGGLGALVGILSGGCGPGGASGAGAATGSGSTSHTTSSGSGGAEGCDAGTARCDGGGVPGTGGSAGTGGSLPCTYTVSGAQTGSSACSVVAAYNPKTSVLGFTVTTSPPTGLPVFTFGCSISGATALVAGTYTLEDVSPGAGSDYVSSPTSAWFMCTTQANCGEDEQTKMPIPPQGSFTLTVTDPGPAEAGVAWLSPQGTLVVKLPAKPGTTASDTVTVTVTL